MRALAMLALALIGTSAVCRTTCLLGDCAQTMPSSCHHKPAAARVCVAKDFSLSQKLQIASVVESPIVLSSIETMVPAGEALPEPPSCSVSPPLTSLRI